MAKLYFTYATMGSGKSSQLLQVDFNYRERGMKCLLLTAAIDDRYGKGRITSRLGISAEAQTFGPDDDLIEKFLRQAAADGVAATLIDEIQFADPGQIFQIARAVDMFDMPVMCYGLRSDFQGNPFPGSAALLTLADTLTELKTVCHCGRKATMVLRKDADGNPTLEGEQIQIGGNDTYEPLCRKHWLKAHGMLE